MIFWPLNSACIRHFNGICFMKIRQINIWKIGIFCKEKVKLTSIGNCLYGILDWPFAYIYGSTEGLACNSYLCAHWGICISAVEYAKNQYPVYYWPRINWIANLNSLVFRTLKTHTLLTHNDCLNFILFIYSLFNVGFTT